MRPNQLTSLQRKAMKHYVGGEFAYCTTIAEVEKCGDTLALFVVHEAHDAATEAELARMMSRASDELRAVANELEGA